MYVTGINVQIYGQVYVHVGALEKAFIASLSCLCCNTQPHQTPGPSKLNNGQQPNGLLNESKNETRLLQGQVILQMIISCLIQSHTAQSCAIPGSLRVFY